MGHREIAKTNWRRCAERRPRTGERCYLVSGHDGPHATGTTLGVKLWADSDGD